MLAVFRRSWELLDPDEKVRIGLLVAARILSNALDVAALAILGLTIALFVDASVSENLDGRLPQFLISDPLVLLAITGTLFAMKSIFAVAISRWLSILLGNIQVEKSRKVANYLFSRGLGEVKKWSQPRLNWLILNSTESAFYGVLLLGISLLAELTSVVALVTLMLLVAFTETLVTFLYFVLVITSFYFLSRSTFSREGGNNALGSISSGQVLIDLLSTFREIIVLGKLPSFIATLISSKAAVARSNAINFYLSSLPRVILETALVIGALAFVGLQTSGVLGPIDPAQLGVLLAGSLRLLGALLPIQRAFTEFKYIEALAREAQSALEKILVLDVELEATKLAEPTRVEDSLDGASGVTVEIDNISFTYDDLVTADLSEPGSGSITAVGPLTIRLNPGDYVALVGPSGAGKSTIVDLMLGLYEPSSGVISLNGRTPEVFKSLFPGQIGYVPQAPGLVSGTIVDNIALGTPTDEVDLARLAEAIRLSELGEFIEGLPEREQTHLGALTDGLSGGQRQRIGLARALYVEPSLLVLDEATSALDPKTERSITDSLQLLQGRMTICVIAHRLSTVKNVDKIYVIEDGQVLASGSFEALRKSSPVIRNYVDLLSFDA